MEEFFWLDQVRGVEPGTLQMTEYDPLWAKAGEEAAAFLRSVITAALAVEHVGSTAIPGMMSKPIIDIAVLTRDPDDVLPYVEELEKHGIHYVGEYLPGQREFYRLHPVTGRRDLHVHVTKQGQTQFDDYLDIRDFCRADADAREAYILLKRALLLRYARRPEKYGPAKSQFIQDLLADAREWRSHVSGRTETPRP